MKYILDYEPNFPGRDDEVYLGTWGLFIDETDLEGVLLICSTQDLRVLWKIAFSGLYAGLDVFLEDYWRSKENENFTFKQEK